MYHFVAIIAITISSLVLVKEKRSFFSGIAFCTGIIMLLSSGALEFVNRISLSSSIGEMIMWIFLFIILPIVFIFFSLYFLFNTKIMSNKEGRSLTAKLSAFLGINLLLTIPLFIYLVFFDDTQLSTFITKTTISLIIIDFVFLYFFICYLLYSIIYQLIPFKKRIDYVIVLGSGIKEETVTPLLKSRLDKALEYYSLHEGCKLVVSGGKGADEPIAEAVVMRNYLMSKGVDFSKIIVEDQSCSTYENMLFSKKLIQNDWENSGTPTIVFSTNNYHVLRAAIYAKKVGLNAQGVGAPTAFYFLPSALIREYFAIMCYFKWFSLGIIFLCFTGIYFPMLF